MKEQYEKDLKLHEKANAIRKRVRTAGGENGKKVASLKKEFSDHKKALERKELNLFREIKREKNYKNIKSASSSPRAMALKARHRVIREQWERRLEAQRKLSERCPKWVNKFFDEARQSNEFLKTRSEDEWVDLINQFKSPVKERIACLVWWDFFSEKKGWNQLDIYLNSKYHDIEDMELIQALLKISYPSKRAFNRICYQY